ncbi:TolC family protein [Aquirufa echingensis]|uniref:TolC family protein n=1 Tax=Aquirufa echingensis TaxID=3096516 RepID=A0ABW6CYQ8_9BACT
MKIIICTLWAILLFGKPLLGQNMTLAICLEAAQKSATSTKQKEIEQELARLNAQIIQTGWLPQIAFNGQTTYQSDVTGLGIEIPNLRMTPINKDQYKTFVDVNQLIYDGGASKIRNMLQEISSNNAQNRIQIANRNLLLETQKMFFSALLAQENHLIWETAKEEIIARKTTLESGLRFGARTKNQLDILDVELLKIEQQITDISAAKNIAVDMLNLLTGLNLNKQTTFQIPQDIQSISPLSFDTFEMKVLQNQQNIVSANQELNQSKLRPKAIVFGQGGYGNPALNMLRNEFQSYYLLGIRLNWDISSFYTKNINQKSEQLQKELINQQKIDLERQISMQHTKMSEEVKRFETLIQQDRGMITLRERISKTAASELDMGTITATQFVSEKNAEKLVKQAYLLHTIQKLAFLQDAILLFGPNSNL